MLSSIIALAAGMALPFGAAAAPAAAVAPVEVQLRLEIVRTPGDFVLNALLSDAASERETVVPLERCASVDLDPRADSLFGPAVRCGARSYRVDVEANRLVVVADQHRSHLVRRLPEGPVVVNGVPLLIEAARQCPHNGVHGFGLI